MDYVTILRSAGLGATDISRLLGLNRTTVSLWLSRKSRPHSLLEDKVTAFVRMSEELMAAGKLPLRGVPRSIRKDRLEKLFSAT